MNTSVLVIAEHNGEKLVASTARTVHAAAALGATAVSVAVIAAADSGDGGMNIATEAAALSGVTRVVRIHNPANAHPTAAAIAAQIVDLAADFSHLLAPATTFGRDLMPRVAALLDTAQVSDVIGIESPTRFRRPIYAGNAVATVEVSATPVVATIRVSAFPEAESGQPLAPIETLLSTAGVPVHTRFVSLHGASSGHADLQTAARVVSGGRGVASAEGFQQLNRLARLLGAAVGATRAAVDAGFAPNELQVGQTGKVIAPDLYIALGISGAIQHLAGIRDAGTIVAINRDGEAPIFEVADIGLVADLFETLPELEALLSREVAR